MLEVGILLQNRYCLKQRLNNNPGRQTWLAEDCQTGEHVIVKLLALGGPVQWDDLKLFEREAQVLKRLDHPCIPACLDYFSLDDRTLWFGLVQNYIPGTSLKQRLSQAQGFSPEQVRQVAEEVLALLDYLHQLTPPVLHRDLKPSNLIWGEDDRLYLIDFGAVQAQPTRRGATFTVVGTYGYTPMEQFGGQAAPASDLYALGATLIHLLTGIPPADLPQKELRLQFRDRIHPRIDPHFISWLEKLTEPSLDRRFRSVQQALDALQTRSTVYLNPPTNTIVRLQKSPERLQIEIPSLFELQLLQPFGRALRRVGALIHQGLDWSWQQFSSLGRRSIDPGAIARAIVILVGSGFTLIIAIAIVATLFPLAIGGSLIFFLIYWSVLSQRKINYFGRTHLVFDTSSFEIARPLPGRRRTERGTLTQIEDISLVQVQTPASHYRLGLCIATRAKRGFLFFSKPARKYIVGNHLTNLELQWLAQEIRLWLSEKTTEPFIK